jgi:hypothetical protein
LCFAPLRCKTCLAQPVSPQRRAPKKTSQVRPADATVPPAINYYSPTLFGSLGITDVALYTGIYGLVKGRAKFLVANLKQLDIAANSILVAVASIIFYVALIDIWGRRRPTIVSSLMCSLCLWVVGAYVKIGHPADIIEAGGTLSPSTKAGGQAATAMIMIYSVL